MLFIHKSFYAHDGPTLWRKSIVLLASGENVVTLFLFSMNLKGVPGPLTFEKVVFVFAGK